MDCKFVAGSSLPKDELPMPNNSDVPSSNGEGNIQQGGLDSVVSPPSTNTLARFEFELGRGNEGSKVLMVEWDCSCADGHELDKPIRDGWEVSWEGKSTAYPLHDDDENASVLRVYFLLPENAPVPAEVTISHPATGHTLSTKCMPAIFSPGLGTSPPDCGKRGVLHTIWAKKRVAELQAEIDEELQSNSEGVALEMVIQEREWLIDHFGFVNVHTQDRPPVSTNPQGPRSAVGGRLGEMLKGLRLATSTPDLAKNSGSTTGQTSQPVSRDAGNNISVPTLSVPVPSSGTTIASLDAILGGSQPAEPAPQVRDPEDELFALPMSPRSPEMKTSPFSLLR